MIKNFLTIFLNPRIISTLTETTNTIFGRKIMDVTAKSSANYSDADITIITEEYQLEPTRETVDALAERLNKTPRSIIAKLSALGVYQKQVRVTKRGEIGRAHV